MRPEPPVATARLVDPELHATGDPHALWRWMREHAPVHRHAAAQLPEFWSLVRYDDVRAVYRDPAVFSSAQGVLLRPNSLGEDPGGGLTLALTDPPRHTQLRSMVAPPFAAPSARSMEEFFSATTRQVLARAVEQGECDFAHDVAGRLSIYVVCHLMGVPAQDHETLFGWTNEAFVAGQPLTSHVQFMQYFIQLMYERMSKPAGDLVSLLVDGTVDGELLTEEEVLLNCENIVGATENTGLSMASGLLAFLNHPDEWRRLQADRGLLNTAVEEVLRWTTSATHSMRTVTAPTVLRGLRIAAGDRVVLWLPSANRDAEAFPEPDRFDIGRRPNRHLALGTGEHGCIGATMARKQTRILFSALLDMTAGIERSGPVVALRSIAVNGPERLPVRIMPR